MNPISLRFPLARITWKWYYRIMKTSPWLSDADDELDPRFVARLVAAERAAITAVIGEIKKASKAGFPPFVSFPALVKGMGLAMGERFKELVPNWNASEFEPILVAYFRAGLRDQDAPINEDGSPFEFPNAQGDGRLH